MQSDKDQSSGITVNYLESISDRFQRCATNWPKQLAVKMGRATLTYEELDKTANCAAHAILRDYGPAAEPVLALFDNSPSLFISLMGIFKAGKIYVPVEPSDPLTRLSSIVRNSHARLILTDTAHLPVALKLADSGIEILNVDELPSDLPDEAPHVSTTPDAVACILYTSGSTGEPKGVMQTHRNVQHANMRYIKAIGLRKGDRVLRPTSLAFGGGFRSVLTALTTGAAIVALQKEQMGALPSVLMQERITVCHMPPTVLRHLLGNLSGNEKLPDLRLIYIGGDGLTRTDIERFREVVSSGCVLVHALALTETGAVRQYIGVESALIEGDIVPVGHAMEDMDVILLNENRRPVSNGETGEIAVRSRYLSPGYWGRPDLTQKAFLPDPDGGDVRIYLTGDLGRLLPDGCLVFLGRKAFQFKIRGYSVSGTEVKTALESIPGIRETFLVARDDRTGDARLVAYVVRESGAGITVSSLRRSLAEQLPEYMIPSVFVFMDALPVTSNGKIDRSALPEPDSGRPDLEDSYVAPSSPIEELLAGIWCEVLGLKGVGIHDNFFELGGHSLLATQVMSRLRKVFEVEIPLRTLFESPTVEEFAFALLQREGEREEVKQRAALLQTVAELSEDEVNTMLEERVRKGHKKTEMSDLGKRIANLTPEKRALLERHILKKKNSISLKNQLIPRRGTANPCVLSFSQQRLWFLDQLEPGSPAYNIPHVIRLSGRLNVDALDRSLGEILRRHEVLRTTFSTENDQPLQRITPATTFTLPFRDFSAVPEEQREAKAKQLATEEASLPFDLVTGPLMRTTLLRLDPEDHILLLTMHHIISDGWSMGILYRELSALYEAFLKGKPSPLAELPIQYADFAVWQREWLQGKKLEEQLTFWKGQLREITTLELPTDHPRPLVQTFHGATHTVQLPMDLTEALRDLSRKEGATLFMTLLTAFQSLLHRYTGQDDIVVGTPIANRNREEIEGLIGFFVNTLVMRTDTSGNPAFRELLKQVRKSTLDAYTHQDLPFEKLIQELHPERDLSRNPLFQVMFALQNTPVSPPVLSGLTLSRMGIEETRTRFDLEVDLSETREGLKCTYVYNTDLFDPATIERMAGHYQMMLEGITANPDQRLSELPLLTEAERYQLLVEWNNTATDYPRDKCIHELFEEQVEKTPDAIAVVFEDQQLTYRELNERANQLAHYLMRQGVGPEVLVGICVERSLEMVIGVLGILKAGGAYVPLDPAYPKERLAFMLEDTQAPVVLTQHSLLEEIPENKGQVFCMDCDWETPAQERQEKPSTTTSAENLAYVLYTSGSTGKPKGVSMKHYTLCNLISWQIRNSILSSGAKTLQFASLSFDVSFQEIFSTLCSGGTLMIVSEEVRSAPGLLLDYLETRSVERLFLPFVALQQLAEVADMEGRVLQDLREVITAGEQLRTTPSIDRMFERLGACSLYNQYGPTESHVVTVFSLSDLPGKWPALPPIGQPIANIKIYLLDPYRQPVPVGVVGEVHIGGDGLARGYHNRPELTAERFISNPFSKAPGARLYRTGDLARYLPDGNIEFLGRIDHQVKIRGFRIELGEIETVLGQFPSVRETVVVAGEDKQKNKRLVAYVARCQGSTISTKELRNFLKEKLPDYMVPSAYVVLDSLPLTPNGKIDRKALPEPDTERPDLEDSYIAPDSPIEKVLAGIWCEVLGLNQVGVHDNFFELGGHSLLATQVISRLRRVFEVEIPLRTLFESPTVEKLAFVLLQRECEHETVEQRTALFLKVTELSEDVVNIMLAEQLRQKDNTIDG